MKQDPELETVCAIAREGGALCLTYCQKSLSVDLKPGDEPVTEADRAVSDLCMSRLRAAFPDDALLSEEVPDDGSRHRRPRAWLVDPIDGTKDFIAGRPGFAVMIGLLVAGKPVLGVVYQPIGDTLCFARRGQGAFRQVGPGGAVEPLHVSQVSTLAEARMVSSASHRAEVVRQVRDQAGIKDEVQIGSVGIKLSLIAAGERDLYINPVSGRTKLWDTCAPEAILHEAGGLLTDAHGAPLSYEGGLDHPHGLLGSNGLLHEQALERLRPLLRF